MTRRLVAALPALQNSDKGNRLLQLRATTHAFVTWDIRSRSIPLGEAPHATRVTLSSQVPRLHSAQIQITARFAVVTAVFPSISRTLRQVVETGRHLPVTALHAAHHVHGFRLYHGPLSNNILQGAHHHPAGTLQHGGKTVRGGHDLCRLHCQLCNRTRNSHYKVWNFVIQFI